MEAKVNLRECFSGRGMSLLSDLCPSTSWDETSAAYVIRAQQRSRGGQWDNRPKSAIKRTSSFVSAPLSCISSCKPCNANMVQGRQNGPCLFLVCEFYSNGDSIYLYSVSCRIIDYTAGLLGLLSGRSATEETIKADYGCSSTRMTSFTVAPTLTVIIDSHLQCCHKRKDTR